MAKGIWQFGKADQLFKETNITFNIGLTILADVTCDRYNLMLKLKHFNMDLIHNRYYNEAKWYV